MIIYVDIDETICDYPVKRDTSKPGDYSTARPLKDNIAKIKPVDEYNVVLEHPLGSIDCIVQISSSAIDTDENFIQSCGIYRTARKIMDGHVYVTKDIDND